MTAARFPMVLAAISMVAAMGLANISMHAAATRDRPPPAHTGGFGEPTCQFCHDDQPANQGAGTLGISGLPVHGYAPGSAYELVLELSDPQLRAAGFQLAVRFEDGTQAGQLEVPDPEAGRLAVTLADGIAYAHHLYDGTDVAAPGVARWTVRWLAPAQAILPVRLDAAAVAADNDLSSLGDNVYTLRQRLLPRTTR